MASSNNPRKSSSWRDSPSTSKMGNPSSSQHDTSAGSGDSCFLEAGPSKTFTDSTVTLSSGNGTPQSGKKKKVSIRKLSVEAPSDLPMNDDCNELIEEQERSIAELEKSMNKSTHRAEEELDMSLVKTMTKEQIQEHVSRCLQLSTANKINTKNAFALKLIDCMAIMTKTDDESNFAAMACQLDAGAKIYSSRVDAVHQQVVKLVETCTFAEKKKKEAGSQDDEDGSDNDGETGGKEKEKKKKPQKKVIATRDQITRQPKEKDPKDKFVRLEALPGDILNKAKYSHNDLSLTLDKDEPFWMDWEKYKPIRPDGESEISMLEITNRKLRPEMDLDRELELTTIPKLESLLKSESTEEEDETEESDENEGFSSGEQISDTEEMNIEKEIELVSEAMSKMQVEGSQSPSKKEVIKTLFHEPEDSDYHYLKMDSSNFWAGPSYWKRPTQRQNLAKNKKKGIRKKKEPTEVQYSETEGEKPMDSKVAETASVGKKTSTLSKRAMAKWTTKKVTFPQDIHFLPETFYMLYNIDIVATVATQGPDEEPDEGKACNDENHSANGDIGDEFQIDNISADMFEEDGESGGSPSEFRGFPSPESLEELIEFKGFPSPGGSSPFDPNHGFKGFGSDEECPQGTSSNPVATYSGGPSAAACDVYEGENLVPMVKTVKVEPIRIVAKPNRVDIQHLKTVMLDIIRRSIEDQENEMKGQGLTSPRGSVAFKDVLSQLFGSDKLHPRTKEDLTIQMAFLCLLTLINENAFKLRKSDDDDFVITWNPDI